MKLNHVFLQNLFSVPLTVLLSTLVQQYWLQKGTVKLGNLKDLKHKQK